MSELEALKKTSEAPDWYVDRGLVTVKKGYLYKGETPKGMYRRVAKTVAEYAQRPDLEESFFHIMWKGWLGPATPILANIGTDRGLPISCFKIHVGDSISDIFSANAELAKMSQMGGGVGINMNSIRPSGTPIKTGGVSNGVVPWCRLFDVTTDVVSQGNRRGSGSVNLSIEHGDFDTWIDIRNTEGDPLLRVNHLHHCVTITDSFMEKALGGDQESSRKLKKTIETRWENGEPYILFYDAVNRANPKEYKYRGFTVEGTNICSEILQYCDKYHSVVCCLASLNLALYDEWKNATVDGMSVVELSVRFLDAVIEYFISHGSKIPEMAKAVAGAEKARSIGLGVMGWHSLLQSRGLGFDTSWESMSLNAEFSRTIWSQSMEASQKLALEYGEPEWLKGSGRRNMHLVAYAPTRSNSTICGGVSPSVEPWVSNYYLDEASKGDFPVKNTLLEKLLQSYGKNDYDTWKSIMKADGSVQHLTFLSEQDKKVFRTAREIDQATLIRQAAQRQQFVDQGQSLNLFYPVNIMAQKIMDDFVLAWELGVKTLYYMRTGAAIKGDITEVCESCEG